MLQCLGFGEVLFVSSFIVENDLCMRRMMAYFLADSDKGTVPTPKAAGIVEEHINNITPEPNRKDNSDKPDKEQYPHK